MSSTVAHLEGRIVNPDLRDHSLPGPILESWNNDWSSSILGFRCKKFNQRFGTFKDFPKTLVRKTVSSGKVSKFRLNGCTFDHLSSFLPWRTASVIFFTQEDKILSPESCSFWAPHAQNQWDSKFFDRFFYASLQASIASPCVVLWEIRRKRAFPKALRRARIRVRGEKSFCLFYSSVIRIVLNVCSSTVLNCLIRA